MCTLIDLYLAELRKNSKFTKAIKSFTSESSASSNQKMLSFAKVNGSVYNFGREILFRSMLVS